MNELPIPAGPAVSSAEAQDQIEAPAVPKLHRFGKKILALVGTLRVNPRVEVSIWRDVTLVAAFHTARYKPHQGVKECARRLRQVARRSA